MKKRQILKNNNMNIEVSLRKSKTLEGVIAK